MKSLSRATANQHIFKDGPLNIHELNFSSACHALDMCHFNICHCKLITKFLKLIFLQVTPSDVTSIQGLRSAMGITVQPIKTEPLEDTPTEMQDILNTANQNVDGTVNQNNGSDMITDQEMLSTNQNSFASAIGSQNMDNDDDDKEEIDISEFLQFPAQT